MFIEEETPSSEPGVSEEVSAPSITEPTVPAPTTKELIQAALWELVQRDLDPIALDLAINGVYERHKGAVGKKALKAAYDGMKTAYAEQRTAESAPVLSAEESAEYQQKEAARQAEAEIIKHLVSQLQAASDLHAVFHAELTAGGYICDRLTASTIQFTHGARLLPRSNAWIFMGASGSGKTDGLNKGAEYLPSEIVVNLTSISDQFLYYIGEVSYKYLKFGEMSPRVDGQDDFRQEALRQLISDNEITRGSVEKTEGKQNVAAYKVTRGPCAIVATTTKASADFDDQLQNRATWITSDDSQSATSAVLDAIAARAADPTKVSDPMRELVKKAFQEFHRTLKPLRIIVPFAATIKPTSRHVTVRRLFNLILDYVGANALLHQHVRERRVVNGRECVVAAPTDYDLAYQVAMMDAPRVLESCSARARKAFDEILRPAFERLKTSMTTSQILKLIPEPEGTVRHWLEAYTKIGLVIVCDYRANKNNVYMLNPEGEHITQDLGLIHPVRVMAALPVDPAWAAVL